MRKKTKTSKLKNLETDREQVSGKDVSFFKLFRFATWLDALLIFAGIVLAAICGILQPFMFVLFGDVTGAIIKFVEFLQTDGKEDEIALGYAREAMMADIQRFTTFTSILGALTFVTSYLSVYLITRAAIRQVSKIRSAYMESMLNKDISWHDVNQTGDFSSRIVEDLGKIEEALGDKLSTFAYYLSVFISGLVMGFVKGWKLALICVVYFPLSTISMGIVSWLSNKMVKKEMDAYASAGAIAEEVLGSIRTVVAFNGEKKELLRYRQFLITAKKNNIKRGFFNGISNGLMWLLVFGSYGLSFWYGVKLIIDERQLPEDERVYTPANMLTVFFNILVATWNFGQCSPFFQIFSGARAAAQKIFNTIDELPFINLSKGYGYKGTNIDGNISFKNVNFHYPSRREVRILQKFDLEIKKGETVALVGNSGCGKSTCIQLIQRFYDPVFGDVYIDEHNIKEYDLKWLRSKIGVVGQEPALFATTIEENIRYGNQNATFEDIKAAAMKANAHTFINKLPNGYKTLVGERGAQLSGGQKQRIAIARALIRNPSILLLDEATSALDMHSEALVQDALDNASKECTTVIVAHRLSTIRGADRIIVINEGYVVEDGTHDNLMELKGAYYNLVMAQMTAADTSEEDSSKKLSKEVSELEFQRSLSVQYEHGEVEEDEVFKMGTMTVIWNILKLNRPEWWAIFLGSIGAAINGASIPMYSVVFGDVVGVLANPDNDFVRSEGNKFSMYFGIIGVVCGAASFFQWYLFSISGEKLTLRVRSKMFETIMKQEMGWYDRPANGVGALCTKLSSDASGIQGASGQPIGTILNSFSSLGIAIGIAFYYEWRITLVNMCFVPLVFLAIYFEAVIVNSATSGSKNAVENSSKFAVEAIGNIRTVTSLCLERLFHSKYLENLGPHYAQLKKDAHIRGAVMGMSRSLMLFSYAAVIYYGATLIRDEFMDYSYLYKISEALLSGSWAVGNAVAFTPNLQKGITSSKKLFQLLRRVPVVQDDASSTVSKISFKTDVNYRDIKFSYPTRPNVPVLRGLNLDIIHGKTIALVGPSGCGKSTIIQLLERFYDPSEGNLTINDESIKHIKLASLRMHLGIVSQEPNLFDRTILENIAYGDNSREVSREECIKAAKNANIHNFIATLPLGYETRLGEKGTQLSGGQKQRVAIARALVRDPQILLLDEATSALDTESEKVVQEALDEARKGRTCITIAHRLKTIQDADLIVVIDKGVVAEMGTHQELLEQRGIYFKLNKLQMGRK